MADAAVEFLLEKLKNLVLYHSHLVIDLKDEFEILENNLHLFKFFIKEAPKNRENEQTRKTVLREIMDLVYETEDVLDVYVSQAAENSIRSKSYLLRAFVGRLRFSSSKQLKEIAEKMKNINIYNRMDFRTLHIQGSSDTRTEEKIQEDHYHVITDNIVGFDEEAQTLIDTLTDDTSEELDVISICGMAGIGKTTLARMIFCDRTIVHEFPTRIWVDVSQEFKKKNVFLFILSHLTKLTDETYLKTDHELSETIYASLWREKFFIVLDGVWTVEAWHDLEDAFPKSNGRGKIVITTRNSGVAWHANRNRGPHNLRFLTREESWSLFQLEVFGRHDECPIELEATGKVIVEQCVGLPLAIVCIGSILVHRYSSVVDTDTIRKWVEVSKSFHCFLAKNPGGRIQRSILLSYDALPDHLRPCFLYLVIFPKDYEIPIRKLTLLWIAEGFVRQRKGVTLEETALEYLQELIDTSLVMIDKVSVNGEPKTCRMHDMIHEFCRNGAGDESENFSQEWSSEHSISKSQEKYRRICINYDVMRFLSSKPLVPRLRSFLCFSGDEITLTNNMISIFKGTKLLRVLDAKPMKFMRFPFDLTHLFHLRYIVMSGDFKVLPSAISKLWNLQTLIVETTSRTLDIKADTWKMIQLRHIKTNASTFLTKPGKSTQGDTLHTLGTISHQSCTEDVFDRLRILKRLGIRGKITTFVDAKGLEKLVNLEKLKLVNDVFPSPPSQGQLRDLPQPYRFPPNMKSLTLSSTYLKWEHMSTLGMLETLEILKLKDNAFRGKHWEESTGGFRNLEVLLIETTDLVTWTASDHYFPKLKCLVLRNCKDLEEIPFGLAESLQKLDLNRISKSAADSARRIEAAKQSKQGEGTSKTNQFKLYIAHEVNVTVT